MHKSIKVGMILAAIVVSFTGGYFLGKTLHSKDAVEVFTKEDNEENKEQDKAIESNIFVSYNGLLKIKDNTLVNQYDEPIQLRGMSTHGIQWFGQYANKEMMQLLKEEWNSNLFRIAMYTEENGYIQNPDLKNKAYEIIDMAIELDMYVIIDWHILSDNNPLTHVNEAKLFFDEVSEKYKDYPNVIYEICNEPNGEANWNDHIKPYANEVLPIIRKHTRDAIVIVGTGTWSQDVDQVVHNPLDDKSVMYALHFYAGTHQGWLRDRISLSLNSIPIFVSEWGASAADGNGGVYLDEAQIWVDFMRDNNLSWANWSLCDKDESSALLKTGAPTNSLADQYLSESGAFIKKAMQAAR